MSWTEPAVASNTSTWTEPATAAITSSWTEPTSIPIGLRNIIQSSPLGNLFQLSVDAGGSIVTTSTTLAGTAPVLTLATLDGTNYTISVLDNGSVVTTLALGSPTVTPNLIFTSPIGTSWSITVQSNGALISTAISLWTEPAITPN